MSTTSQQVRLNPNELYQLKWLTGALLVFLSVWTLFFLDVGAWFMVAVTLMTSVAVLAFPNLPNRIPTIFWKLSTPMLVVVIIIDFIISRPDILPPLVRMMLMLTILRMIAYRKRREDLQLVLLCLFLVIVAGVLTLSMAFALQILVFSPVAMLLLFLVTMSSCTDQPEIIRQDIWVGFSWKRFVAKLKKALAWKFTVFVGALFLLMVLFSTVIFYSMPRFQLEQALPFLKLQTSRSLSGFSDQIVFGDVVDLLEDNAVALRVDAPRNAQVPQIPYWRMVVLDEYTGQGFRTSFSAKSQTVFNSGNFFGANVSRYAQVDEDARWTFYYESGVSKYLPILGVPGALRFQNKIELFFNGHTATVSTRDPFASALFYQLEEVQLTDYLPGNTFDERLKNLSTIAYVPDSADGPTILRYPETTVAVPTGEANEAFLKQFLGEVMGQDYSELPAGEFPKITLPARDFSRLVINWLHQNHSYSLRSTVPSGAGDRLLRWAASDQPGHCELFAGSFSMVARAAGYPTRLVTGFAGGAWNGYENYYMIRNRDAHAWVEIFDVNEHEWVRVEPTPAGRSQSGSAASGQNQAGFLSIDRTLTAYLDSLRVLWYRRIVNFDQEQQAELAGGLKDWLNGLTAGLKDTIDQWTQGLKDWAKQPWDKAKLITLAQSIGILVALYFAIRVLLILLRTLRKNKSGKSDKLFHPTRLKAGYYLRKIMLALPNADSRKAHNELLLELQSLRYGPESLWPEPKSIFRKVRDVLKNIS